MAVEDHGLRVGGGWSCRGEAPPYAACASTDESWEVLFEVPSIGGSATALGEGSVSIKAGLFACAAGAVIAGSIGLASVVDGGQVACPTGPDPARSRTADVGHGAGHDGSHGQSHGHAGHVPVGPTCNRVEMVAPQNSRYRPDVAGASRADRTRARTLLRGVNAFCRNHSASEVMAAWLPGKADQTPPTHFFDPDRRGSLGLDPSNPRAVLIYGGEIGGVMFTGTPLPSLGSIPRAHTHDASHPREMLHVYCATSIREAFTPSRRLGVLADTIALRQEIRPRIAHLVDPRLTAILRQAREYVGDDVPPVESQAIATPPTADPVLRAKREEIRQSLFVMTEPELRKVLTMVKGIPPGGSQR